MSNISINSSNIEDDVAEIIDKIQEDIIDASQKSRDKIIGAIGQSEGDFINSLKEEVAQEAAVMASVGELLIAMADYIRSASRSFSSLDAAFQSVIGHLS